MKRTNHDEQEKEGTGTTEQAGTSSDEGFEFVSEVPNAKSASSTQYDWAAFPAPQPGRIAKKEFPVKWPTGIRKSIKRYIAGLSADGVPDGQLPAFSVSSVKGGDDGKTTVAHAVYRVK